MIPFRLGSLDDDNHLGFPGKLFDRFHVQSKRSSQIASIASAVVWLPTAILSLTEGLFYFRAFFLDIAAQSRILIVIPLLIVAEPAINQHRFNIGRLFLSNDLIRPEQTQRFENAFSAFERRKRLKVTQVALVLFVYSLLAACLSYVSLASLPPWCAGSQVNGRFCLAGAYYLFIGLPLLVYLVLRWIWDVVLWALFLRSVSLLDLRLVPSHPDLMAGLSFVETILRSYLPFAFSIGIIVAGGVANQVVHLKQAMNSFRSIELVAISFVVLICAGPLVTFFDVMFQARRRGTYEYGKFATILGHEFEAKWINASAPNAAALEVQDFSATTDLYSIAANVRQVKPVPFGTQSILRLVAATIVPGIPVAIAAIPFDVVVEKIFKLLL